MNLAREGNKYFNDTEPWKTVKADKERCGTTLNICLQAIYTLAELYSPVLPFSSEKLFKMLNAKPVEWLESGKLQLKAGHQLNQAEILFPKFEDEKIEAQINKLGSANQTEVKKDELITYDDFIKVQLRVAEVIEAEKVKKSEKLLRLKVKLENEERQVVAGIAKSYNPEDLIGKKVVIVANLQPAKLMGLESKGMILAVENESGGLNVLTVSNKVKNGTRVK
jgi:methionyl-tRNA synthetase